MPHSPFALPQFIRCGKLTRYLWLPMLVILLSTGMSACAPSRAMIATLTQLPITPTLPPPTRIPTITPNPNFSPTPSLTPAYSYPTDTGTPDASVTQTPDFALTITSAATVFPATPSGQETPAPFPAETAALDATAAACPPFTFDATPPTPDTPTNYIGRHYNDRALPASLEWLASGMLSNTSYSYTHVIWQGRDMYWIQKVVCQNPSGTPFWVITDALALPKLNQTAHEVVTDMCFRGEQQVPFVIAYGTYNPNEPATAVVTNFTGWRMQVKSAWQMQEKFTPLDTQGLTCIVQK